MAIKTIAQLKAKFVTGAKPTQQDFWDLLESYLNLFENSNKGYVALVADLIDFDPLNPQVGWFVVVGETDTVWVWDGATSAWKDTDTKGQVTSVDGSTGAVTIPTANTSTTGKLSSTDWNTFNSKQPALGFTPENVSNRRSTFQVVPDDLHYPSEKLVKDSLDGKAATAHTHAGQSINPDNILINASYTDIQAESLPIGTTFYNSDQGDWVLKTSADTYYNFGGEVTPLMKNGDTFTHLNGIVVYVQSGTGKFPVVKVADASSELTSYSVAIATQDIVHTGNGRGRYCSFGNVSTIPISNVIQTGESNTLWVEGAALWLSEEAGHMTTIRPAAPAQGVRIGFITDKSGANINIFVTIDIGSELSEQHDVLITTPLDGDTLMYDLASTTWKNDPRLRNILLYGSDYTGFYGNDTIVETYNAVNRTVSLTGNFVLLYKGAIILNYLAGGTWTSPAHSVGLTATAFLKYNQSGFSWSTTLWTFDEAMIAAIANSGTNPIFGIREVHGLMDYETHQELHQTLGTYKVSGADITNVTLLSTTLKQPFVSATSIKDEDLPTTLAALNSASYTQFYLTGASALTGFNLAASQIVPELSNQPYYNQYTGGAWQQTLMTNNNYQAIFLVGVPVTTDNDSIQYRYMWVQGQTQSATLATIQALTPSSLNLGQLPTISNEYVFLTKFIIRYSANNWHVISIENLTGTRYNQTAAPSGSWLSTVAVDGVTITGDGTLDNPLVASAGPGSGTGVGEKIFLNNNFI